MRMRNPYPAPVIMLATLLCLIVNAHAQGVLEAPHHNVTFPSIVGCLDCHDLTAVGWPKYIPEPYPGWPARDPGVLENENTAFNFKCWECHSANTVTTGIGPISLGNMATHSSLSMGSTKYGEWAAGCTVCHNAHSQGGQIGGKFIWNFARLDQIEVYGAKAPKSGKKTIIFNGPTGPKSFADGDGIYDGICEVCHTETKFHQNNPNGDHSHFAGQVCITCHPHGQGFRPAGYLCLDCHENSMNSRAAIGAQFAGSSHHVQRLDGSVVNTDCYQCHWESDVNGEMTTFHTATPDSAVDLVVYGAGTRPDIYAAGTTAVAYIANGSRAQIESMNNHCLGCHDDDTKGIDIFGDGKAPDHYAWDGTSVDARYSDSGTTTWGKYSGSYVSQKAGITKAFSAHGNAPANQGGYAVTKDNGFIKTESWPNTRGGSVKVTCFDCHNSHGSTASGTTTSYAGATINGGLFKNTIAGKGGYATDYAPASGGSQVTRNQYNAGADLCFDCHLTENEGQTPWGYKSTFGATQPVNGFSDSARFGAEGDIRNTHAGGHFGASQSLTTPASGSINGLCTSCHDPHGVSPTITRNYGVPLLKGTWLTSPYNLDGPKASASEGGEQYWSNPPLYKIDQNTFDSWNFTSTAAITESIDTFGGLCLKCHPKASIDRDTTTTWRSMDRVHETVKGWGANSKHSFPCAKCHTPHATKRLPRLMITNCLNSKHKGRMINNLNPIVETSYSTRCGNGDNMCGGNGKYAAGGQGSNGKRGFGLGISCHDGIGTGTYPDKNLWNNVTPWLDQDYDESYYYTSNPTSPIRDCDDTDANISRALDDTCDGDNDGFIDASAGGTDCNDNNYAIGYVPGICDGDNDREIALAYEGYDCDDNDPAVTRADDGTCDGDGDGFIDWTAGGPDCLDNDANFTSMATDGTCDGDGDGLYDISAGGTDCDDNDANIKATTDGTCDGDNDGLIDTSAKTTDVGMDCDDDDASIGSATDNTCDGDNDTYVDMTAGGTDCNDANSAIHYAPDGTCDGDGDGIVDSAARPVTDYGVDCDDNDPIIKNPSDGTCDGDNDGLTDATAGGTDCKDNDVNITGAADGTCDGDSDGFIDFSAGGMDCDDNDINIKTSADGTCDGDNDGLIDATAGGTDCNDSDVNIAGAADGTCDADSDGFIDFSAGGDDCDDNDANIRAAADGTCDGDGDGFADPSAGGTDCDDNDNASGYIPAVCDVDGDTFVSLDFGGVDCLDTDASIKWAADTTCDGDGDTYIDWTAGGNDCDDDDATIAPPCSLTGNSTSYNVNTLTDTSGVWPANMFTGRSITYHVTHRYISGGAYPYYIWTSDEYYSTRIITGHTETIFTVDSNWDFPEGYTPKEYTITLD